MKVVFNERSKAHLRLAASYYQLKLAYDKLVGQNLRWDVRDKKYFERLALNRWSTVMALLQGRYVSRMSWLSLLHHPVLGPVLQDGISSKDIYTL